MKYYIEINNNSEGPYSIEELINLGIKKDTLVWHDGLTDWIKAESIKELNEFLNTTPPPLPNKEINTKVPISKSREVAVAKLIKKIFLKTLVNIIIAVLVSAIIGGCYYLYYSTKIQDCVRKMESFKIELKEYLSEVSDSDVGMADFTIHLSMRTERDEYVLKLSELNCGSYSTFSSLAFGDKEAYYNEVEENITKTQVCLKFKLEEVIDKSIKILKYSVIIMFLSILFIQFIFYINNKSKESEG